MPVEYPHVNIDTPKFHLFEKIVDLKYGYDIEGQENIDAVREMQKEYIKKHGKPMPMLDVWNHEGTADPAIAGHFTATQLRDISSDILIPVSQHYVGTNAYPLYRYGVKHAKKEGFVMPPIDQSYRGRDEMMSPEENKAFESGQRTRSMEFMRLIREELPKGILISIAPEGHRSPTLNPPEAGAGNIVEKMARLIAKGEIENGIIIPRGIYKNPETGKLVVKVGPYLTPDQIIERAHQIAKVFGIENPKSSLYAHVLMLAIRDLIPANMHGVYSEENSPEYMRKVFTDQIKLITERTTVKGKVKKTVKLRDFTQAYDPGIYIPPVTIFNRRK